MIQEDLREHSAGGVPDQDGRRLHFANDRLEVLDDLRHSDRLDRRRVGVQGLDLDLEPG